MTRYALLIGNNYKGTGSDLAGCINDVLNMKAYLITKQYLESNITLMTDDSSVTPDHLSTKKNIFDHISQICLKLVAGDEFVLHYSGHGGQIYDSSGDEKDRKDETIYAMNLEQIVDDELKINLVNKIPVGCKLRCIFDACHSATSCDLPFIVKSINNKYTVESTPCILSNDIIAISGCLDTQTSADTSDDTGKPAGALTMCLLKALKTASPQETWFELITVVRHLLRDGKYSQIPQLALGKQKLEKTIVDF